jgi:YesN/AraC family two-component response regulator
VRIEEAKKILESSSTPIDEISAEVGYEEPGFFRRLFKRHTGLSPGEYRRLFQPIANTPTQEMQPGAR